MKPTIYVSPYYEMSPIKDGALIVATAEDGREIETIEVKNPRPETAKDEVLRTAYDEYYPNGWSVEWIAPEDRDDHTDFQIALGLNRKRFAKFKE